MPEQAAWTWRDGAGQPYRLDRISCAWRRAASRTPEAAAALFGAAAYPGEPATYWQELLGVLVPLTTLWRIDPEDGVARFDAIVGAEPAPQPVHQLVEYLRTLAKAEIEVRMRGNWAAPELVPVTLRAMLASEALTYARNGLRHHRCEQCGEWHLVLRAGARFCSSACRNEANRAGKQAAEERG